MFLFWNNIIIKPDNDTNYGYGCNIEIIYIWIAILIFKINPNCIYLWLQTLRGLKPSHQLMRYVTISYRSLVKFEYRMQKITHDN